MLHPRCGRGKEGIAMLMTIDVGNTNITVGIFRGDHVVTSFRITTKLSRTSDEDRKSVV